MHRRCWYCHRHAWNPECPRHGHSWRELAVYAYFVLLPIAVVLTGQGPA